MTVSQESDTPAYRDSYSVDFDPIGGTWYFRIKATGEILEVKALVVSSEDWRGRREAKDPAWRPIDFGGLVMAVKTLL